MIPPLLGKQKQVGGGGFLKHSTVVIHPPLVGRPPCTGFNAAELIWWNGKW